METQFVLNINSDLDKEYFSYCNEGFYIKTILDRLKVKHQYCVDLGASDGLSMSNTFPLFRQGWQGLAVECDSEKFAKLAIFYGLVTQVTQVNLCKAQITPNNVNAILRANEVPREFGLLSLDIDSYDHFVLEKVLQNYKPTIICTEINATIPPPIRFAVKWQPDLDYRNLKSDFFGQSLSQLYVLGDRYGYELAHLEYNNAFLIPKELNPFAALTPGEAYKTGYSETPDRLDRFPWSRDSPFDRLHQIPTAEAIAFLQEQFAEYEGRYLLSW